MFNASPDSPRARFAALLAATRLYAITDDRLEPDRLIEAVERVLQAGVRLLQYRDKRRSDLERVEIGRNLVGRAHRFGALLVVNDRADIALAAGADGAHLGQEDLPLEVGRSLLGSDLVLGASASYLHEIEPAQRAGADYIGFGAVFPTDTKLDAEYAGLELLDDACQLATLPIIGIGGITAKRAPALLDRGAAGVAVVSALFRAPDPAGATAELLAALKSPLPRARGRGEG